MFFRDVDNYIHDTNKLLFLEGFETDLYRVEGNYIRFYNSNNETCYLEYEMNDSELDMSEDIKKLIRIGDLVRLHYHSERLFRVDDLYHLPKEIVELYTLVECGSNRYCYKLAYTKEKGVIEE